MDPQSDDNAPADPRLTEVLEEVFRRRATGEQVSDLEVIKAHPHLMPELGEQLTALQQVCRAQHQVRSTHSTFDLSETGASTSFPDSFTGYEITREVHRGGQGVVYQAIQKSTKRKVAIKVMREGPFAGRRDKARFEREVQVLGQLRHPQIVTVHDSGVASGCHYFVMDYISGKALDEYLAETSLSVKQKLGLFAEICEAVNDAHLRGVIHRDLKPGNIRIDSNDRPHILDFGLAKLAIGGVTEESSPQVMTVTGQFIGSLPWASPEQAEGRPDKIDVRTDVYSLGVILYQMLTGRFPYEVAGSMKDVLDNILLVEPRRPTTLDNEIDDETETIVLKGLQKDRQRRYQTGGELARDVRRYLAGEPIEAKRDSGLYVLKKTLQRHKLFFAVAAVFLVTVGIGLVVGLQVWQQMQAQRRQADVKTLLAEGRTLYESREHSMAEEKFNQALALDPANLTTLNQAAYNYFLQTKDSQYANDITALDKLEDVGQRMQVLDPARASLYLGHVYKRRGMRGKVIRLYEECINSVDDPRSRGSCQSNLGAVLAQQGDFEAALELLQESVMSLANKEDWHAELCELAAVQLHLKEPGAAAASIRKAQASDRLDPFTWLISARIAIRRGDFVQAGKDADFAYRIADDSDDDIRGKACRIQALAHLKRNDHARAAEIAAQALHHDDMPTINYLVMAIAHARQGAGESAALDLRKAQQQWPDGLIEEGAETVSTEKATLWVESADELKDLQRLAEKLLPTQPRTP